MVKFDVSPIDADLILKIVLRFRAIATTRVSLLDAQMDVTACHCNGTKLDLEKLLKFPDFDFLHDMAGIRNCIDRETGKLTNCFLPRCARGVTTKEKA